MQLPGLHPRSSRPVLAAVSCWEFVSLSCLPHPPRIFSQLLFSGLFNNVHFSGWRQVPDFFFFFFSWRHSETAGVQSERTYTPAGILQLGLAKALLSQTTSGSKPFPGCGATRALPHLTLALAAVAPAEPVAAA